MKTLNPRVFLREGELYAFVEELPNEPKPEQYGYHGDGGSGFSSWYCDTSSQSKSKYYKNACKKYESKTAKRKASAIKVKNQDEALRYWNHEQLQNEGFVRPVDFYTLEGYQMEVVRGKHLPCELAIISPVVQRDKFDPHLPCGPKKQEPNTERLIDKVGKAKRVIRDTDGKAIGFEPFIKEPTVIGNLNQDKHLLK